jgi:hypothetical protein
MQSSHVMVVPTVHVYTETRFDKLTSKFLIRKRKTKRQLHKVKGSINVFPERFILN